VALTIATPAAILQPISGDLSARQLAVPPPVKLAAAEALFETRTEAPLVLGGWPDVEERRTRFGVEVPMGLSLLAFHDPHAEVQGLDKVPPADWPNVPLVHIAFQIMVGLGTYLALVSLWVAWRAARRGDLGSHRSLMLALVLGAPMGFLAVEAGWMVTELGRQPWIIFGVLRTREALTPMPGLVVPLTAFTLLYCFLGVIVAWLLYTQIIRSPVDQEWSRRYDYRLGILS
jgi:cytochrome d ubiquinol oxidase subunit I